MFIGVGINISNQVEAEQRLIEEIKLSDALFRSLPGIVYMFDESGRFVRWNQGYRKIFGFSDEEMEQLNALDTVAETDRARFASAIQRVLLHGETSTEVKTLAKDGSVHPMFCTGTRVDLKEQHYLVGVGLSIADRVAMEDALRASERKYRDVFNSTSDALFIHDQTGAIVEVNEAMCAMFGYDAASATAQTVENLSLGQSPYSQIEAMEKIELTLKQGPQIFEWRSKRRDGTLFWSEVSLHTCEIDGKLRVIASVRDIDERKHAHEAQQELQASLRQAQKMESIGRLAGGVAHDFNNLLMVISGNVALALQDLRPEDPIREILAEVDQAAESAAELNRKLLAFSRKQVIEPVVLDLNEVLHNLQKMLPRLLGEDIEITLDLAPNLGKVRFDPGQLEQVVVNLAVNSRDAMPNGGQLHIETSNITLDDFRVEKHPNINPGEYALLSVSDTGLGMNSTVKDRIFEPFFTTKDTQKGTGLGLAMVYGAIKQNQGDIEVSSELGQGTNFSIYLPRVVQSVLKKKQISGQQVPHGNERILLVEDEARVRAVAVRMLERQGYTVIPFGRGEDVLRSVERTTESFDLLITDVVMPGMNGRMLAEKMIVLRPKIKVLFTSGYAEEVIAQHGILQQGIELLPKPYSLEKLAQKVRKILDNEVTDL
jgi:PAS domain S-box-containing protein